MNDKRFETADAVERPLQEALLAKFDEIAKTFLDMAPRARKNGEAFAPLQVYLDGAVEIGSSFWKRRTVLLAIHDMKEEREAPLTLQSKTLSRLILLKVRPIPHLKLYRDIATAILRMEVVIRLEALQVLQGCLVQRVPAPADRLLPALGENLSFDGPLQKAPRHNPN